MIYINRISLTWCWWCFIQSIWVTWCCWWFIQKRGVTWWQSKGVTRWWWWWYLLRYWLQEPNNLSSYFFPSLIWKFTNLTSGVLKGVLKGVWIQVNKVDEHGFFGGGQWETVHGVLAFLKSFTSLLLKMKLLGGCLLCCLLFCLFLFSTIIGHQYALR